MSEVVVVKTESVYVGNSGGDADALDRYDIYLGTTKIGDVSLSCDGQVYACRILPAFRGNGYMSKAYSLLRENGINLRPSGLILNNKMVNYWNKRGYSYKEVEDELSDKVENAEFELSKS